jgi:uncharacterized protein
VQHGARAFRRRPLLAAILGAISFLLPFAGERATAQERPAPLTVVVFGDSQGRGIARGLARILIDNPHLRVLDRAHPGAALDHQQSEWMDPIERFLKREKAAVAVVMFGANDRIDIREPGTGKYLRFRTPAWRTEYIRRTDMILKALAGSGMKVIWCGNPIARSPRYSADMRYINEIYAAQTAKFGVRFLSLWDLVANPDGSYEAFGKGIDGITRRLRGDDGIHFTSAGYELVAERILGLLPALAGDGERRAGP